MMARRMRAWRPTRTPGIRMHSLDVTEAVHPHVRTEHAAGDGAARHDAPGRNHRIERLAAALSGLGEHELRRRRLRLIRPQRPLGIVQVELRVHLAQVHVRFEIRVERADVAPVLRRLLVLVVEAIRVHRHLMNQRRNDVLAEIVRRSAAPRRPRARGRGRRCRRCTRPSRPARNRASRESRSDARGFSCEAGHPLLLRRPRRCRTGSRRRSAPRSRRAWPRRPAPGGSGACARSPSCRRGRPTARSGGANPPA